MMMVVLAARVSGSGLNRVPMQEEKNDGFWGIGSRGRAKVRNEFQINSIHFMYTRVQGCPLRKKSVRGWGQATELWVIPCRHVLISK